MADSKGSDFRNGGPKVTSSPSGESFGEKGIEQGSDANTGRGGKPPSIDATPALSGKFK